MATKGRPVAYQSDTERPVTVSLRIPRDVYTQVERYVKMHHGMTLTEFVLDGIQLRLATPADPRDMILSDDNTIIRELQEMIRAEVQAEIGKLQTFMGSAFGAFALAPAPEVPAEPIPELSHDNNTVIQEKEESASEPAETAPLSYNDNTVLQEQAPKRPGRRSTLRQPIIDLLREHPEGLTAVQIKVHLGIAKNIGDTLAGMTRDRLIEKQGSGNAVRYLVR